MVQWSGSTCQSRGHLFDLWLGRITRAAGRLKPLHHSYLARAPTACALWLEKPPQ